MKKIVIVPFLCGSVIAMAAPPSTWTEFFEGADGSTAYVNIPSLAVRQGKARVWTLMSYLTRQYDASIGSFKSIEQEFLIDCGKRQVSLLQAEAFQESDMTGAATFHSTNTDAQAEMSMRDAAPSSMTSELIARACH